MNTLLVFLWIYAAMIATSFWEAYSEGRNSWDKGKLGFKIKLGRFTFSAYHFFLYIIMWPLLLTLPFIMFSWDLRLFGIVLSAFFSGLVIEDFMWYLVNPVVKVSELNTDFAKYYPRLTIGRIKIPLLYLVGILLALISWYFIWR